MFGIFQNKKADAEVMEHWYSLVPGFSTSGKEFYTAIEAELKTLRSPRPRHRLR